MNIQINNANSLPVPTWRWLKLNDTNIQYENISNLTDISPNILNVTNNIIYTSKKTLNIPQIKTGCGYNINNFIKQNAVKTNIFTIKANTSTEKPLIYIYDFNQNLDFMDDNYIFAEENSKATIIFVYASQYNAQGFHASSTKVFAKKNAQIEIIQVQALGQNYFNIDDFGALADENAFIKLKQIALGATQNYLGANIDLLANKSNCFIKTNYLSSQNQSIDMNYIVNIFGEKTTTNLLANGILMDNAKKIHRGTLDFKQGCKGSIGTETEEILLLDEDIHNKSIPLILCAEDDIEGNHSVSIGEMDSEQLFYLQTRGLTTKQIRQMQINSKLQLMCNEIPENLHQYILNFAQEAFGHEQ